MRRGDHGHGVRELQDLLRVRGATDTADHTVDVDGDFGRRTDEALRRFQRANGLHADGVAGPESLRALREPSRAHGAAATAVAPSSSPAAAHALLTDPALHDRAGARAAQSALAHLGYTGADGRLVQIDGVMGINSRHAVQQSQRDHGLPVTGRVDDRTQDRLAAAERTMASTTHPAHGLYRQSLIAVQALDHRMGIPGGAHTIALAGVAAAEAARAGLTRVDRVDIGSDRAHVRVVQFNRGVDDWATNRTSASIELARAVNQPLEASSQQAAQAIESRAFVAGQLARQQAPMRSPVL